MELCSIQDAFPDIKNGKDSKAAKEERRAARKRAKKCKGPAEEYLNVVDDIPTDPDRPAVKRMGEIPAYIAYEDAFIDLSGGKFEGFKMPTLPTANCLIGDASYPSYFGKGLDDADDAAPINWPTDATVLEQQAKIVTDKAALDTLKGSAGIGSGVPDTFQKVGSTIGSAGYALYNSIPADEGFTNMFNDSEEAEMHETFEYEFGGTGNSKAGAITSKTLPAPSLDDAWKPLTPAKTTTAFFKAPKAPKQNAFEPTDEDIFHKNKKAGRIEKSAPATRHRPEPAELPAGADPEVQRNQMAQQMRELTKKFEDLEAKHQRDTKNEVLLFVGTGLFILVSLDIVARLARR
jgi:hypothetical protein